MSASSLHEETKEKQETEQSYYEYATTEGAPVVDDEDFKRREVVTVRKLDLYVTPVLMGLQLISYLDRGNIGFAATQGMVEDIGLKGAQLNVSALLPLDTSFVWNGRLTAYRSAFQLSTSSTFSQNCLDPSTSSVYNSIASCQSSPSAGVSSACAPASSSPLPAS